jgi:hypothetical protein
LTLLDPGDEAAVRLFGRWPRGAPFRLKPGAEDRPTTALELTITTGDGELRIGSRRFGLSAPPDPSAFAWTSVGGPAGAPQKRESLPVWANAKRKISAEGQLLQGLVRRLDRSLAEAPPLTALAKFPEAVEKGSSSKQEVAAARALVVYCQGALDDLPRLVEALGDTRHPEARDTAVEALRHWIGRAPGQDQVLYDVLVKQGKYSPALAETVMQLLHSPFDDKLPETYEVLIGYLRHEKLPVRELARWHLQRLAPGIKDIPYDAAGTDEEREKAYREWKKRIPDGSLPPK